MWERKFSFLNTYVCTVRRPKLAWLAKFQPATEIDQLQLTFFVLKIESGYIFLWNMIGTLLNICIFLLCCCVVLCLKAMLYEHS